jgi:hypothetical protein
MLEIVTEEITATYHKNATPFIKSYRVPVAISDVVSDLAAEAQFAIAYVSLFTVFPDQRALPTMRRIFERINRPIPARFQESE